MIINHYEMPLKENNDVNISLQSSLKSNIPSASLNLKVGTFSAGVSVKSSAIGTESTNKVKIM